jgi:hypothetical protein
LRESADYLQNDRVSQKNVDAVMASLVRELDQDADKSTFLFGKPTPFELKRKQEIRENEAIASLNPFRN